MDQITTGTQAIKHLPRHTSKPPHQRHIALYQNRWSRLLFNGRHRKSNAVKEDPQQINSGGVPVNYIKHLNKAMQLFYEDDRLLSSHIATYMALFQVWNENRFLNPITINRMEIMKAAKINSFSTYTKCLRQLHEWEYLEYMPSHNPSRGTRVNLYNFCTTDCTSKCTTTRTDSVQPTVQLPYIINNININKESERAPTPTLEEVFIFFKEKEFPAAEAEKFYNYFQSNGWKVGGKAPMQDWQAAARNWMLNTAKFNTHERTKQTDSRKPKGGNLHTGNDKDYSEPL